MANSHIVKLATEAQDLTNRLNVVLHDLGRAGCRVEVSTSARFQQIDCPHEIPIVTVDVYRRVGE